MVTQFNVNPIILRMTPHEGELVKAVFESTNLPLLEDAHPELRPIIERLLMEIEAQNPTEKKRKLTTQQGN